MRRREAPTATRRCWRSKHPEVPVVAQLGISSNRITEIEAVGRARSVHPSVGVPLHYNVPPPVRYVWVVVRSGKAQADVSGGGRRKRRWAQLLISARCWCPPANHDPSTAAQHPRCQPAAGLEISQISQKSPLLRPAPNAPSHFILTGLKSASPRLQLFKICILSP